MTKNNQAKKHASEIMKERSLLTREAIKGWFYSNPFLTASECSSDLGFNIATISRHVQALKAEAKAARNNGK